MGFFSKLWEGAKAAAQFVVRATVAVVHAVVDTVKFVAKKTIEAAGYILEKTVEAAVFIGQKVAEAGRKIIDAFRAFVEKIVVIIRGDGAAYAYDEAINDLDQQISDMKKEEERLRKTPGDTSQQEQEIREAREQAEQYKKALILKKQTMRLRSLIEYADRIRDNEWMHDIQHLARLEVSLKFLASVSEKQDMVSRGETRFIDLIDRFLHKRINTDELVELDIIIQQREGRSLLSIGNEYLIKLYKDQETALLEDEKNAEILLDSLVSAEQLKQSGKGKKARISEEEVSSPEIADQRRELIRVRKHLEVTQALLAAIRSFQFIYDNEAAFEESGALWEDQWVVEDCVEISRMFVEIIRTNSFPTDSELADIKKFGHVVNEVIRRFGSYGAEDFIIVT